MIKLSTSRNEVLVDETQSYQLKEINEYLVCTLFCNPQFKARNGNSYNQITGSS